MAHELHESSRIEEISNEKLLRGYKRGKLGSWEVKKSRNQGMAEATSNEKFLRGSRCFTGSFFKKRPLVAIK